LMACTRLTSGSFSETVISSPSDTGGRGWAWAGSSQHAADATLHLSAFQRELPQPDVVQGLDALAPGVDLRLVHLAGGHSVLEEQREAQPLVHVLGGGRVGVD